MKAYRASTAALLFLVALGGCMQASNADNGDAGANGSGGSGASTSDGGTAEGGGAGGLGGVSGGGGVSAGGGGAGASDAGADAGPKPLPGSGCPATSGFTLDGVVRLGDLHATPEPSGPSVIVKVPCGREQTDPTKATCGTGVLHVLVCTTPDCSAASDPVRSSTDKAASLKQSSFDSSSFKVCGLTAGKYYVLPILDHDESGSLSNYDWTMGVKNIASSSVKWPARVEGYGVDVQKDTSLPTKISGSGTLSPIVLDYFYYKHPSPTWKSENNWLYLASTLHPNVSTTGVGIRALDLGAKQEVDQFTSTPEMDALGLAKAGGALYEGDLTKLAFDKGVAYLGTPTEGLIYTVKLGADGSIVQGHTIDLTQGNLALDSKDVMQHAAVVEASGKRFLVVSNRVNTTSLPQQPTNPLLVIDLAGLASGDVIQGKAINASSNVAFDKVRFDDVMSVGGVLYAAETGNNSEARRNDGLNQLWAITLTATGDLDKAFTYAGEKYNAEGDVPECGSKPPYVQAGLWVGSINGETHAALGNLRTLSFWKFAGNDPSAGTRVLEGTGPMASDKKLDDFAVGYSVLRSSPDGKRLFVFGDCKSHYLSVRAADWAGGAGARVQSRRRIAVLDLEKPDSYGVPVVDATVGDTSTAPDIVRVGQTGQDKTLSDTIVGGLEMDCRAILWNLFDVYGYQNVAGNLFNSDCVANRVRDAVVTDSYVYVIGRGSVAFGTTGLGVSSELMVLDRATGRQLLEPNWQWFYEGSAFQNSYGYFGVTLGERNTTETSKGLFLVSK